MNEENYINDIEYAYYVGIKLPSAQRSYFFSTNIADLKEGDPVIVETVRGKELGLISSELMDMDSYTSKIPLKPIIRRATESDIRGNEQNTSDAKEALKICADAIKDLDLNMNLLSAEYTLDKSKIIFSYVADERVDFRELLKILAARLRTRIELRQIGTRDKAKLIGGIGICGLPLCCTTFLNEFDGISIARAKNQMLAINIPKLSGHCGKLICCLKYEDEAYTEAKKEFPNYGDFVFIDKKKYTVTSFNIISRTIKLDSEDDVKFLSLEEYKQTLNKAQEKRK